MRIDRGRVLRHAISLLLVTVAAVPAFAQQATDDSASDDDVALPKVLIEAKGEAKLEGAEVATVDKATLQEKQVDSLEELSRRVDPSIDFNPDNGSVNIRGLDSSRVLTTIDGIPIPWLNEPIYEASGGSNTFDFDTLSQIDILKGTDSSRYGSGSLGGILGLRTLDPDDLIEDGRHWGGLSKLSYDSKDDGFDASQAVAARFGGTSALFQGSYRRGHETDNNGDVGGTGETRTEPNPLDSDQYNVLGKIYQDIEGGHRFGLTAEHFTRKEDIETLTSIDSTYSDFDTIEKKERTRLSLSYDYVPETSGPWFDELHALAYWQDLEVHHDENTYRETSPVGEYDRDDEIEKKGFGSHVDGRKTIEILGQQNEFVAGTDFYVGKTEQYTSGKDSCGEVYYFGCSFFHVNQSYQPDIDSTTFGVFVDDTIRLGDSGFTITPGVRFDWYEHDPQDTPSYDDNDAAQDLAKNSDSAVSGKLRAAYQGQNLRVYGQWAQGFRAPTTDELFTTYGSSATYLSIGNPELEPETSNGFQAGLDIGDDALGGGVTGFLNYYRNFIDTETTTAEALGLTGYPYGVFQYINRAHVRIQGVEANAHWRFLPGWKASVSLALIDGEDTDEDETLDSIPPYRGIFDLAYDATQWGAGLTWTVAGKRDDVDGLEGGSAPGYGVLDLRANWKPEQIDGFELTAGVYNLFDQTYYNALHIPSSVSQPDEFYSEPGRSFKVTATYKF
ncbi:TonB-dependent hemoglobin/transferrin/lactoferrin family receptor [Consotaella aegiceratis]|uniref:TonB-dependent hemoglobin/transferrin/lactoferrin family receptor n=1 Tax=Consotaella aegiceratis TaxID=3097961 RepID=UPI002F418F2C